MAAALTAEAGSGPLVTRLATLTPAASVSSSSPCCSAVPVTTRLPRKLEENLREAGSLGCGKQVRPSRHLASGQVAAER